MLRAAGQQTRRQTLPEDWMVHVEGEPTQTKQTRTPEKEYEIQARKVIAHFHCCL